MIAIYPGTFDPFTNGHLDLLERSLKVFDKVILAVAEDTNKNTLFTTAERTEMVSDVVASRSRVKVVEFDGLLVDFAQSQNAGVIIRGLRAVSDFEYEFQLAAMNRNLNGKIETMFLTPAEEYSFISSSMIKSVVKLGGDASKYLPPLVLEQLKAKLLGN
jgi:pantetheine-phosphate adenylyltransferase